MSQDEKKRLLQVIKQNLDEAGHRLNGRPLNVVFFGEKGVGKSSLINTIAAAMSTGSWRQHAYSGGHAEQGGRSVTVFVTRFPQCCRPEVHRNPLMPTLVDIGGLPDQLDAAWEETLRLLLYGLVPEEENLLDVLKYVDNKESVPIPKYTKVHSHLKIDRIIVVASVTSHLPQNLLQTVIRLARPTEGPYKRSIPVFGVMTKTDLVLDINNDLKFAERERLFINTLGLSGEESRFARCINYCSQVDPDNDRIFTTFPYLDVPVLTLMTQVCDPVLGVVHAKEDYPARTPWYRFICVIKDSFGSNILPIAQTPWYIFICVIVILLAVIFFLLRK